MEDMPYAVWGILQKYRKILLNFIVKIINNRYNMNDFKIFSYKEDSACEVNLVCDQIRDLKNAIDG